MNVIILKTIRNFFVVNICFLVPFWWALFGWMPDQAKIYMRGQEGPGAIVARGLSLLGEDNGPWREGRIYRFYLCGGMKWKDLVFQLPGETGAAAVDRIELQKWKLLALGKSGRGLMASGERPAEYVFQNPRFERLGVAWGKVSLGFGVLEIILLGVSWWSAKRGREEARKNLWPSVLGMALVLTLLMQVALPMQSYLANRAAYSFSVEELGGAVALRFAWMSVLTIAALGLLVRYFGSWVLGMTFAFAICVYLESGILSNGLERLNGDIFLLQNRMRALWDATVWIGVFALMAVSHGVLRKHYGFASMCLLAMVAASMLDTKRAELADKSRLIVDDFVSFDTVIQNVAYSTNRNVLVFILDSMEREQAHDIMEDSEIGAKLREQFRGFTEYTNNVGASTQTLTAVPNLLTGRYPDDTIPLMDYSWSGYGKDSALATFLATGHDAYLTTPGLGCGYASTRRGGGKDTGSVPVLNRVGNDGRAWSVLDFTRWRWLPFGAKASCSWLVEMNNHEAGLREWATYPALAKAEFDDNSIGVFMLIHTEGVHVPVMFNRHGEMLPTENRSYRGAVEQGAFVLGCLADLMDAYRRMGIYDKSLILVLGDHGVLGDLGGGGGDEGPGRLTRNARPFLWVKPMESQHGFVSSDLPTSHAQVADLLKASANDLLSESEIQEMLQADRRVYRQMSLLGTEWTDWIVDRDGVVSVQRKSGTSNLGKTKPPLQCGRLYSLNWRVLKNTNPELTFIGADVSGYPCMLRGTHSISIQFRPPETGKTYALKLGLYDGEGGTLRFHNEAFGTDWKEFPVQSHGVIVLRNLKSDAEGLIKVTCERGSAPEVDVAFTTVLLEEE